MWAAECVNFLLFFFFFLCFHPPASQSGHGHQLVAAVNFYVWDWRRSVRKCDKKRDCWIMRQLSLCSAAWCGFLYKRWCHCTAWVSHGSFGDTDALLNFNTGQRGLNLTPKLREPANTLECNLWNEVFFYLTVGSQMYLLSNIISTSLYIPLWRLLLWDIHLAADFEATDSNLLSQQTEIGPECTCRLYCKMLLSPLNTARMIRSPFSWSLHFL